jgi:inner membrane protein
MMFGHMPGSYTTMTLTERLWRRGLTPQERKVVYACGILAGVAPDVDVLFAGIAEHRGSIVHTPFLWVICAAGVALLAIVFRQRRRLLLSLALAILIGAATHILLDAIFVGVRLLYPLSSEYYRMIPPISSRYDNWILNYLLHPIFLTEIRTFVGAAMLWRYRRAKPSSPRIVGFLRVNQGVVGLAVLITVLYLLNWYVGIGWRGN